MKQLLKCILVIPIFYLSCKTETKNSKQETMQLDFPIKFSDSLNEKMKSGYWKCNDNSNVDSSLHYFMIIPKNVKPGNLTEQNIPGTDRIKQIASYRRIDEASYLEIQVVYEQLRHEINASDWQENLLRLTGENIIKRREIKGNAGTYLDALSHRKLSNGEVVVSRTTSKKNFDPGNKRLNIVCVKVSCNSKDYPELAEEMMAIATEWEFINKSKYQLSEDLNLLHMKKDNLAFYFPKSWEPSRIIVRRGFPERYALFNKIDDEESVGAINLFLSDTHKAATDFYKEIISRFDNKKIILDIEELREIEKDDSIDKMFSKKWAAKGFLYEDGSAKNEISIVVLRLDTRLILLESVSVGKEFDNYNWARNKRATELVLNTLQLYKENSKLS